MWSWADFFYFSAVGTAKLPRGRPPNRPPPRLLSVDFNELNILAMLRAPSGVTIDAMMHAMGWQQHSVRGFLSECPLMTQSGHPTYVRKNRCDASRRSQTATTSLSVVLAMLR